MINSERSSHESLSLDDCDRLVLSPPAVPFNPNDLVQFLSDKRAKSAKHSLHSVNTEDGLSSYTRHVSIAWSQSEYDAKFKKFDPHPKSSLPRPPNPLPKDESLANSSSVAVSPGPAKDQPVPSQTVDTSRTTFLTWKSLLCCHSRYQTKFKSNSKSTFDYKKCDPIRDGAASVKVNAKLLGDVKKIQSPKGRGFTYIFGKKWRSSKLNGLSEVKNDKFSNMEGANSDKSIPSIVVSKSKFISTTKITAPPSMYPNSYSGAGDLPNPFHHRPCEKDRCIGDFPENENLSDSAADSLSDDSLNSEDSFSDLPDRPTSPGKDLLGNQSEDCLGKKCLVLDLDETLVHSSFKQIDDADFSVMVDIENTLHEVLVCKRPHLETFIEAVGPLFECVMFTASLSKYADPVCDQIDAGGHFKHRLFRESCAFFKNNYIKHLNILGRDIDQICIIDNSPISFYFNRQNAIQIVSWFDDPNDTALLDLIPYLKKLAATPSVLDFLKKNPPPASAAISQPELDSWLYLPPDLNGFYEIDDDDTQSDMCIEKNPAYRIDQVITMACRPGEIVSS